MQKNATSGKILLLMALVCVSLAPGSFASAEGDPLETITYNISPIGKSEYQDFGTVDLQGAKVNLVVFKTFVAGFKDTEKIYSDPKNNLPLRVERDVTIWLHNEKLVEEYTPKERKLVITKFEGGKKTDQYNFKSTGPIHNAVLLPFSIRKVPQLKIGWSTIIRLPSQFKVKLSSIEDITVPAGKFKAYHFTSEPSKFEIWISSDKLRIPIKIKGLNGLSYTLSMVKYNSKQKTQVKSEEKDQTKN